MIVEERIYVLHTHVNVKEYLEIYSTEGLPAQLDILGGFLGYFTSEIGTLNQLVHLWAYSDLEDRRRRRETLAAHAGWQACLKKIRPMIMTMENRILIPTAFSPLPGALTDRLASAPGAAGQMA